MRALRIVLLTVLIGALLSATAYGAGYAVQHLDLAGGTEEHTTQSSRSASPTDERSSSTAPSSPTSRGTSDDTASSEPEDDSSTSTPSGDEGEADGSAEKPEKPKLTPGPSLFSSGDSGEKIRDLQARLKQIAWLSGSITGSYDDATVTAVRGFQAKREIPKTGEVDQRTLNRLHAMTREPTHEEKHNIAPPSSTTDAALDPRCTTGRALCIDKTSRTLRWVVDGTVKTTVDVRFGATGTPTREGSFHVESKSRDHVSSLYDSPMPFAMFFSGGQAVHYSSDFASRGYNGASHGCVNVRDYAGIQWLFDQVQVGDKVIVYWS